MPLIRVPIRADGPIIDLGLWTSRALAHALVAQGQSVPPPQAIVLALIGRDMLAHSQFVYDGPNGELLLVY